MRDAQSTGIRRWRNVGLNDVIRRYERLRRWFPPLGGRFCRASNSRGSSCDTNIDWLYTTAFVYPDFDVAVGRGGRGARRVRPFSTGLLLVIVALTASSGSFLGKGGRNSGMRSGGDHDKCLAHFLDGLPNGEYARLDMGGSGYGAVAVSSSVSMALSFPLYGLTEWMVGSDGEELGSVGVGEHDVDADGVSNDGLGTRGYSSPTPSDGSPGIPSAREASWRSRRSRT